MSTTIFASHCHGNSGPVYPTLQVAGERRRNRENAKYRAFGEQLEKWRGTMPLPTAARLAGIGESTLRLWEGGQVGAPDPLGLVALSRIYGVSADRVFAVLAEMRGVQLPKEVPKQAPTSVKGFTSVGVLEDKIAAGPPLVVRGAEIAGRMVFPQRVLDQMGVTKPVCVVVGDDERSMWPTIHPRQTVLLDCADARRFDRPKKNRIYAVNVDDGATLKRILLSTDGVYLVADNPDKRAYPTQELPLEEGQSIDRLIVGEVMWWGESL